MNRTLALLLLLVLVIGGYVFATQQRLARAEGRAADAETQAAGLAAELREAALKERVVIRYVDRVRTIVERGATLTREVPVYVTAQADHRCTVPVGFVRLHDAAAENAAAVPAGDPDAPAEGIALSDVAETVAANYTLYHETAAQLTALQDYVRGLASGDKH